MYDYLHYRYCLSPTGFADLKHLHWCAFIVLAMSANTPVQHELF